MVYLRVINYIAEGMGIAIFLMLFHYLFFSVAGIFMCKKFPQTQEKLKYAIMIGARNEEKVIAKLIRSIRANDYPQDKITVFVLAHNCTDDTARIAREEGAVVYEYNNPNERTLGYAYRALLREIAKDYPLESFDGIYSINADNILSKNYLSKMNDAYVAYGKEKVITSYRNSANFSANYMSCLYGLFFLAACRYEARGRTFFGCSTRVSGTGYVFNPKIVREGWQYTTLTEDWEFTADQIAQGNKVYYCDEAEFSTNNRLTSK